MSIGEQDDLPFIPCGLDHGDPPVGYWNVADVFGRILPLWWGERAHLHDLYVLGHDINDVTLGKWCGSLAELEQKAQWREVFSVFRSGAQNGDFEVVYEDGRKTRRIPADRWGTLSRQELRDNLMWGQPWTLFSDDDVKIGMLGAPFLMREEEIRVWLRNLKSPHVLPNPLVRDPSSLLNRPAIFLSEAMSWLAHGEVIHAEDWLNLTNDNISKFENWLATYGTGDMPKREVECLGNFIAKETSANLREEAVEKLLIKALLEERLSAVGVPETYGANASPETIDKNTLLLSVSLDPLHDCVRPSGGGSVECYEEARAHGHVFRLRFQRSELVASFGAGDAERIVNQDSTWTEAAQPKKSKGGRPRVRDEAARIYEEIYPNGHGSTQWKAVLKEINNHGGLSVDLNTLKRGLGLLT